MNSNRLSKRLLAVASFVEKGAIVADIGSDHAYLPSYLVNTGVVNKAIAGEVAEGPYQSALSNVTKQGLKENITVRLANGLFAIKKDDQVDTVTIAGMGGPLIVSILENGHVFLNGVNRIIVQPNINAKVIRQWAVTNGWKLINEQIMEEDEKIYEILVLERGIVTYDELELLVGPYLMAEKNPVFHEKWESEITQWNQVLKSIEKASETADIRKKREQLTRYIDIVEEVLAK